MVEREGLYIVIEGHDGTGKSTQVELLRNKLATVGIESVEFHEPAGTPIADELRKVIKNGKLDRDPKTDLFMFSSARCEIWQSIAQPALKMGQFVVASRNWWSTEAYQGYGDGISSSLIKEVTQLATDERYISPDIGIILSLEDEEERQKRISGRGELETPDTFESKSDDYQERVRTAYIDIARERNIPVINANQSVEAISEEIWQIVEKSL